MFVNIEGSSVTVIVSTHMVLILETIMMILMIMTDGCG